ncbi:hypothetical protein B0H19DRAFT_1232384 [Mycena capillaripes]|nr:hypothetical protein B0H19DRAFT_1232384 [Mycena capillaripes]
MTTVSETASAAVRVQVRKAGFRRGFEAVDVLNLKKITADNFKAVSFLELAFASLGSMLGETVRRDYGRLHLVVFMLARPVGGEQKRKRKDKKNRETVVLLLEQQLQEWLRCARKEACERLPHEMVGRRAADQETLQKLRDRIAESLLQERLASWCRRSDRGCDQFGLKIGDRQTLTTLPFPPLRSALQLGHNVFYVFSPLLKRNKPVQVAFWQTAIRNLSSAMGRNISPPPHRRKLYSGLPQTGGGSSGRLDDVDSWIHWIGDLDVARCLLLSWRHATCLGPLRVTVTAGVKALGGQWSMAGLVQQRRRLYAKDEGNDPGLDVRGNSRQDGVAQVRVTGYPFSSESI